MCLALFEYLLSDGEITKHPYNGPSLAQRYASTLEKKTYFASLAYTVVEIWEHEFFQKQKTYAEFREFIAQVPVDLGSIPVIAFW